MCCWLLTLVGPRGVQGDEEGGGGGRHGRAPEDEECVQAVGVCTASRGTCWMAGNVTFQIARMFVRIIWPREVWSCHPPAPHTANTTSPKPQTLGVRRRMSPRGTSPYVRDVEQAVKPTPREQGAVRRAVIPAGRSSRFTVRACASTERDGKFHLGEAVYETDAGRRAPPGRFFLVWLGAVRGFCWRGMRLAARTSRYEARILLPRIPRAPASITRREGPQPRRLRRLLPGKEEICSKGIRSPNLWFRSRKTSFSADSATGSGPLRARDSASHRRAFARGGRRRGGQGGFPFRKREFRSRGSYCDSARF